MEILTAGAPSGTARYSLTVATGDEHVRAAQALRHQVFAEELGATLRSPIAGLDIDFLDPFCDHLVITETLTGDVVGTYRMLPPGRTDLLYCDGEFDLRSLAPLRNVLVETGRACVHPAHRSGAVIGLMWAGIARYMHLHDRRWLIGCASVPLAEAATVWRHVQRYLAPPLMRVTPHHPWPVEEAHPADRRATIPPLLRGYLRLGAWVCGPPAHDPDFGVADLPVLLALDRMDPRYLRHFLDPHADRTKHNHRADHANRTSHDHRTSHTDRTNHADRKKHADRTTYADGITNKSRDRDRRGDQP
ncbi:MAG: hypothetical protein QOJ50_1970 [Cryptosporangiaceae bacterium]|nr:hypothetical protein [Cryptosporangiaceae bacterium]